MPRRWQSALPRTVLCRLLAAFGILLAFNNPSRVPAQSEGRAVVAETYGIGDNVFVRSLAVDEKRDALWIGTSAGVMRVDLKTRVPVNIFTRAEGLANENVCAAVVGPNGRIWFGTNAGGLSIFDGKVFRTFFPMHGLADYWVRSLAFASDGKAWLGTLNGVNRLDAVSGDFETFRGRLIDRRVQAVVVDGKNRVWFGTDGGVGMFDGVLWWSYRHEDGLGATAAASTAARSGPAVDDYNPNRVLSALIDNRGRGVWFGTWGGGVSLFDGKSKWVSYSENEGLAGAVVHSIAQEKSGVVWFGTNKGLSRFDGTNWERFGPADGLVSENIHALAVDRLGTIWAGGRGGITRIVHDGGG